MAGFESKPTSQDSLLPFKVNWLRTFLAFYFVLMTYVVCRGLIPLPDEPPRIKFWGLFYATASLVIAFHFLVSRYRLFWVTVIVFIPFVFRYLSERMKFLEMMLEPRGIEDVTRWSLAGILLVMLTPRVFRMFNKPAREYRPKRPLFFRKGIPF